MAKDRRQETQKLLKKKKAELAKLIADKKKKAKKPSKKKAAKKVAKKKAKPKILLSYRAGDFVCLLPFGDNLEAYGQIQSGPENEMYVVKLNEKHRDGKTDDLLRELSADQMRHCLHPNALVLKESHRGLFTYKCPACERTWDVDTSG